MKLYISGAMSMHKDDAEDPWHFGAFNMAEKELRAVGFDCENPADKGVIDGWSWSQYLKFDLKQLLECDGVAVLPGWFYSAGANLEVYVAKRLSMPVFDVAVWVERAEA